MKSVVIFLLLVFTGYSQPLKYKENNKIVGCYAVFNGTEFLLKDDGYAVFKNSIETAGVSITGKKVLISSPSNTHTAVANFAFHNEKKDYLIRVDVYSPSLERTTFTFPAPYGLPHPSINITDKGEMILFDPLTYAVEVHSLEGKKEYLLEKSVDYEMERSFYTEVDEENFYLLIMEKSLNPGEDADNVFLYITDLDFNIKEKRSIDIDVPVAMVLDNKNLLISGVDFRPAGIDYRSFLINDTGTEVLPYAFEKLKKHNDGYAAKYGSRFYLLNENYKVTGTRDFNSNIVDIAVTDAGTAVLIKVDTWKIYNIGEKMEIDKEIVLDFINDGNPPLFGFAEDTLILHSQENTFIFNELVRRTK